IGSGAEYGLERRAIEIKVDLRNERSASGVEVRRNRIEEFEIVLGAPGPQFEIADEGDRVSVSRNARETRLQLLHDPINFTFGFTAFAARGRALDLRIHPLPIANVSLRELLIEAKN